jgi:hypothetical protein
MKVLFLNHTIKNCGVYQYGKRLADILMKTPDIEYIYVEVNSFEDYKQCIIKNAPHFHSIIYNYHNCTMSWLDHNTIQKKVKNIGIPHESNDRGLFDTVLSIVSDMNDRFSIPRPIFENIDELLKNVEPSTQSIKNFIEYSKEGVPIFGSFGFGILDKGFDKIVQRVHEQYDEAIIKLIITDAFFNPKSDSDIQYIKQLCLQKITKPNITLLISREFFTNEEILLFLNSNTMNIFLYDHMHGRALSSTIDYAISVKKPLGISDSYMFRHIYSDDICLYKKSIHECMMNSPKHLEKFLHNYSHINIINRFKDILSII